MLKCFSQIEQADFVFDDVIVSMQHDKVTFID
jgi:hypothetical protein